MNSLLSEYQKHWFRFDAVAGMTTAAVVIPKSMAYAGIAGIASASGPLRGARTHVRYALLGSVASVERQHTSTLAILTAAQLTLAVPESDPAHVMAAASTLALLVGGFLIMAGLLRLGFLANFISDPVLTGFKAGMAGYPRRPGAQTAGRAYR